MPARPDGWEPAEHACRFCGGRIARQGKAYRCFHCDAATERGVVADICGCGLQGANGMRPFICAVNPDRSPQNPAIIVIVRADPLAAIPTPAKERA